MLSSLSPSGDCLDFLVGPDGLHRSVRRPRVQAKAGDAHLPTVGDQAILGLEVTVWHAYWLLVQVAHSLQNNRNSPRSFYEPLREGVLDFCSKFLDSWIFALKKKNSFVLAFFFLSSSPCFTFSTQPSPFSRCFFSFQPLVPLLLLLPHLRSPLPFQHLYCTMIFLKKKKKATSNFTRTICAWYFLPHPLPPPPSFSLSTYTMCPFMLHNHFRAVNLALT